MYTMLQTQNQKRALSCVKLQASTKIIKKRALKHEFFRL